jgi:hypothetical protein
MEASMGRATSLIKVMAHSYPLLPGTARATRPIDVRA